jgi:selenide, water dikinase
VQFLPAKQDLVLVGGGHSHALALRMLAMTPLPDTRITLVSPESLSPYSGMLPGLIAGHYQLEDTHVDLPRLCQWAGVRFIRARALSLDARLNRLTLDDGSTLDYDWLSLDVGSTPALDQVPGARDHAIAVKPVADFRHRWQQVLDQWPATGALPEVTIVGGGAGGTEIALAMATALSRRGLRARLTLICAGELLAGYPARLRQSLRRHLRDADIQLREHQRVRRVSPGVLHAGEDHPFQLLFWCTGATGPGWLADSGLALTDSHFVQVNASLQSCSHSNVFAAGDCAMIEGMALPRAGVYAVRQAATLAANLRRSIAGQPLRRWKPQKHFLSLLAAGSRDAAGSRGRWSVAGPWVWRWKDRIDRRFMAMFEQLPARRMAPTPTADEIPRCAGCGAKVGSEALQQALAGLAPLKQDSIIAGVDAREDASVLRWPPGQLLVQSQDFFPAFIDEPALFGRICVLHSLSDIYAMNAQPHSALATVTLPVNHQVLQGRDLKRLMRAAVDELNQAGCSLLGGHTLEGPQLAAGFAVNGSALEEALFHKGGARPGDLLLMTKALGTGVILAARMQLKARAAAVDATLASMLVSNGPSAAVLARHGVRSCTDITGFGVLGHLLEMCRASGCGVRLEAEAAPLLPDALSLANRGVASTLKPANDAALAACQMTARWHDHPLLTLLTDPQTSGGLLAAVPAAQADACLADLRALGVPAAAIGRFTDAGPALLELV